MKLKLHRMTLHVYGPIAMKNAADPIFRRTTTHIKPAVCKPRLDGIRWKKL